MSAPLVIRAGEIVRSSFAAEIAVDALLVDIEFARGIVLPLFCFVSHETCQSRGIYYPVKTMPLSGGHPSRAASAGEQQSPGELDVLGRHPAVGAGAAGHPDPHPAGRLVEGHGVVLWQPGMNPREVAGLASTRTYPLRSSFRPSYTMAVNLVHQVGRSTARELLESSFAQYQADKAVVGLARQLRKAEEALEGYAEAATCHLGDFMEYAGLRRRLSASPRSSRIAACCALIAAFARGKVTQASALKRSCQFSARVSTSPVAAMCSS